MQTIDMLVGHFLRRLRDTFLGYRHKVLAALNPPICLQCLLIDCCRIPRKRLLRQAEKDVAAFDHLLHPLELDADSRVFPFFIRKEIRRQLAPVFVQLFGEGFRLIQTFGFGLGHFQLKILV